MRKSLTVKQVTLYSQLQAVAATESPEIVAESAAEASVGRALQRRGLAVVEGRTIRPTPEAIEFRLAIKAKREAAA